MAGIGRREFLRMAGGAIASAVAVTGYPVAGTARGSSSKPNVLLILADDMGYGDAGCYNPDSKIPTPNIDALAAQGMRFTNAHSPGAVCIPTRYGLLTGRFPFRKRETDGPMVPDQPLLEENRVTLPLLFRRAGYRTGCIGKWHLGFRDWRRVDYTKPLRGGPVDRGFDYFFGMHASLDIPPYFYIENDRCVEPPTQTIEENHSPGVKPIQGAFWRAGKIAPNFRHQEVLNRFTDKAIDFVRSHQRNYPEKPFFLYYAMSAPHTPWLPSERFRGRSGAGPYGDFVAEVDAEVGRLLAVLKELQIEDSTLVIFTSDNGPVWYPEDVDRYGHRSAYIYRGMKGDLWEGGHRMPFIVRWPGFVPPGSVRNDLVCFTDLLATFAGILGQQLPPGSGEDSFDISPLLQGRVSSLPERPPVIIGGRALLTGRWKFIEGSGRGGLSRRYLPKSVREKEVSVECELYDLKEDPGETKNLAKEKPEVVSELRATLQRYKESGYTVHEPRGQ